MATKIVKFYILFFEQGKGPKTLDAAIKNLAVSTNYIQVPTEHGNSG
jgi:hypothetical protein